MSMKHRGFETGYSQKMPLRNQECKDDIPFDSWAPSYFIWTNSFSQGARLPKAKPIGVDQIQQFNVVKP
jgi:hypothetical protein